MHAVWIAARIGSENSDRFPKGVYGECGRYRWEFRPHEPAQHAIRSRARGGASNWRGKRHRTSHRASPGRRRRAHRIRRHEPGDGHGRDQNLAAAGTGGSFRRRPRRSRRMRCAAGGRTVCGGTGDPLRSQRVASAPRGRSCAGRQQRDLGADAGGQCRCRLSPCARARAKTDRGAGAWLVPVPDLAPRRHAAQPAALFNGESGARDAGEGTGQDFRTLWNPGQRAGARRGRRRRFRRRSGACATYPARPPRPQRRPRADGARGAVEPGVGLRHGSGDRGRRRPVADELVRAS